MATPRFYLDTNTGDVVVELASRRVRSACPERVDNTGFHAGVGCAYVEIGLWLLATMLVLSSGCNSSFIVIVWFHVTLLFDGFNSPAVSLPTAPRDAALRWMKNYAERLADGVLYMQ